MSGVRVIAPAKINWTLEVLRIRPDGYHEIRSVLQTIGLHDVVTLHDQPRDITLELTGEVGTLDGLPREDNLAYRAVRVFRDRSGVRSGARIVIEKHVPIAAGLGGGSSDAAAVIRGLNVLWGAGQPDVNLMEIAGEIGSDPPFFIAGGTAMASGRGDEVEPLSDAVAPEILLALPPPLERGAKTAAMYEALAPAHFSEGYVSIGVRETVMAGRPIVDEELNNVFERVAARVQPETELAMDAVRARGLTPHLAGAGPAFFVLLTGGPPRAHAERCVGETGFDPRAVRTLPRERALSIEAL